MKIQNCMPLLCKQDVEHIFNDGELYERNSFYVIDKITKQYDVNLRHESYLESAKYVRDSFLSGHTIVVKNLENFNERIRKQAALFGRDVDVHMYLVPGNGGDSFDFHKDDRDVYIRMVYGKKTFILLENGVENSYSLSASQELFIPIDTFHKAIPHGASCLLSFGVNTREYYKIFGGITVSDL